MREWKSGFRVHIVKNQNFRDIVSVSRSWRCLHQLKFCSHSKFKAGSLGTIFSIQLLSDPLIHELLACIRLISSKESETNHIVRAGKKNYTTRRNKC